MTKTIDYAERKLDEAIEQNELGAKNDMDIAFWQGYIEGARDQAREVQE